MKYRNVFWGVLLLTIGSLYALRNFDVIHFEWSAIFSLWPLLLILWGISMLPVKPVAKLLGSLGVLVLAVILMLTYPERRGLWSFDFNDGNWSINDDDRDSTIYSTTFDLPASPSVNRVKLELEAAAGRFYLADTTSKLVWFKSDGNIGPYLFDTQKDGDTVKVIHIGLEGDTVRSGSSHNEAGLKLNDAPIWDISIDAGAASLNMDMSRFKVRTFDLEGGASSVELKFGALSDTTDIDIEVGVSSIKIAVPKGSGCELRTESVLSGRSFDGFDKIESGLYRTPGFATSGKKVYIKSEAAVSDIKIERY